MIFYDEKKVQVLKTYNLLLIKSLIICLITFAFSLCDNLDKTLPNNELTILSGTV
jgi:hypothetical protein